MRFRFAILSLLLALPLQAQLAGTAKLKTTSVDVRKAAGTTQTAYPEAADLVGGSVIGYAARPDGQGVYSLLGFPGAASPGPTAVLARAAGSAVISSVRGYALAAGQQPGELLAYSLRPRTASGMLLPSTFQIGLRADRIVIAPLGRVALVYDRERRQVEVLAGLPSRPNPLYTVSLDGLPGALTALAVSDDGAVVLAAVATGEGTGQIFAFRRDGAALPVASVGRAVHLAFVPESRDGLAADYDLDQVLILRDGGRQGTQILAGRGDGVRSPAAVEAATDGSVFVVNSGSRTVLRLSSAQAGTPERIDCECAATGLDRLKDPDSFRLTSRGALTVVNAGRNQPPIFHVPGVEEDAAPASGNLPAGRIRKR